MKLYKIVIVVSGLFLIPRFAFSQDLSRNTKPVNIILMIADGMGISQITGGLYQNDKQLAVEKMPFIGLQKTNSFNSLNTDPAAAATAIACGIKSFDGALGLSMDSVSIPSILEWGTKSKMKTGVITTASMTHATVAAFWAHLSNYQEDEKIASQLIKSPLNLVIGGGEKFFSTRKDNVNLLASLSANEYQVVSVSSDAQTFPTADILKNYFAFTAFDLPSTILDGRKYLPSATSFAIDFLNAKDKENHGFFLLVNSAQTEWGAKLNNPEYMLTEYEDFNQTIEKVLSFAEKDRETLVIVTSGYELGGYAINPGSKPGKLQHEFTGKRVTGTLVPVFSYGPGAFNFTGFYENIDFLPKLKALFGWN